MALCFNGNRDYERVIDEIEEALLSKICQCCGSQKDDMTKKCKSCRPDCRNCGNLLRQKSLSY